MTLEEAAKTLRDYAAKCGRTVSRHYDTRRVPPAWIIEIRDAIDAVVAALEERTRERDDYSRQVQSLGTKVIEMRGHMDDRVMYLGARRGRLPQGRGPRGRSGGGV